MVNLRKNNTHNYAGRADILEGGTCKIQTGETQEVGRNLYKKGEGRGRGDRKTELESSRGKRK